MLAKRGHHVTLFEKEKMCGGQFYIASFPPFKQPIASAIKYYLHQCEKYGVEIKSGVEVTNKTVKALHPDVLVVATGAIPINPRIKGIETVNAVQANDVLLGKAVVNGKILVIGGGLVGAETADYSLDYTEDITIVEMFDSIMGSTYNPNVKIPIIRRFKQNGVKMLTKTKVVEFQDNHVIVESEAGIQDIGTFDMVILALGAESYIPFEYKDCGVEKVYVIGDAVKARTAVYAIEEGARLALKI